MKPGSWQAPGVIHRLTAHFEPWLSCDDCFDEAGSMVENLLFRDARLPEPFRAHMRGCAACREETETLAELVAADNGIPPGLALARLDSQIGSGYQ